jgi:hypothetical protein
VPSATSGGRSVLQRLLDLGAPRATQTAAAEETSTAEEPSATTPEEAAPVVEAPTPGEPHLPALDLAPSGAPRPEAGPLVQRALVGEWRRPTAATAGAGATRVQRAVAGGPAAPAALELARPTLAPGRPAGQAARSGVESLPLARSVDDGASPAESTTTPALQATYEPAVPITVSRARDALTAGATEVPIQRADAAPEAPAGHPGAAAVGGAGGAASSPEDVEALAQKLLAPMMRRIRAEMLLDRERRGLRTDSW